MISRGANERIGFIGLGNMGGAIALRLLRAGYPVTVLDLDAKRMDALIRAGAATATTPAAVAELSTVVIASLQPESVEQVACGQDGLIAAKNAGFHFVDLSSMSEELAVKISRALRQRGIEMLDAPVSGADIGATNGNLTLFVGGTYPAYQRCLPVLQQIAKMVTYLGPNGNGQVGKKINQMMQALSELAIYEGMLLAEKKGLPLQMFARAASAGCAQTWRLDEMVNGVFNLGEKQHRFRLRPGRTGNALKMAEQLGIDLPGTQAAHRVFARHNWEIVIDFDHDKVPE